MSKNLTREEVLFRQRFLSCCGFYQAKLDGLWGEKTDEAERQFFERSAQIAAASVGFDPRTERNLLGLQCDAQAGARASLARIRDAGFDARIISGTRSYAEQAALFNQGRFGNKGPVVTNARAGQSWHNFGLAWDIGLFDNGKYVTAGGPYQKAGPHGRGGEVEWGGDWKSFKDFPHYQFGTKGQGVAAARARFEAGGRG